MRWTLLLLTLAACAPSTREDPQLDAGQGDVDAGSADAAWSPDAAPGDEIDRLVAAFSDPQVTPTELDAMLVADAWSHGWPMHVGSRWLFARRWDGASANAVLTGEWVDWSTTALPVKRAASGAHVYVLLEGTPHGLYKWWDGAFQAPTEATVYGVDANGEYGMVEPPAEAHLERFPGAASAARPLPRTVRVRVPARTPSRVLLLQDGQNVFDPGGPFGSWHADVTLADPAYADVLAVAVDNTSERIDDYTPVQDLRDGVLVGGHADDTWALIDQVVLPFIAARYGVSVPGPKLAVVGSSMGGLFTLHGALHDPARAGCSIGMSPTLYWGSIQPDQDLTLIERWSGHLGGAIVIDSGGAPGPGGCLDSDGDGISDDGGDSDNYCVSRQLADTLAGLGYQYGVDLAHWWQPGAEHNEAAWAARLPDRLAECAQMGWLP